MNNGKVQAEKHWEYSDTFIDILNCLKQVKVDGVDEAGIKKFYIAVFEHGYKHGYKDAQTEYEVPRAPDGKYQKKVNSSQ